MKAIFVFLFVCFTAVSIAEFRIEVELVAPGTRSEGKRGALFYNDLRITPAAEKLTCIDGRAFSYIEPKYMWSHAGWKESKQNVPETTGEVMAVNAEELNLGYYYAGISERKQDTPEHWVFMETSLYSTWLDPEKINSFLGLGVKKEKPFEFMTDKRPAFLWKKDFFATSIISDMGDFFRASGYEKDRSEPMIYEIRKKNGTIQSAFPLPRDVTDTRLTPSYTINNNNLYYFSGSMNTGRFTVFDLKSGDQVFRKTIYFTHYGPVRVFNDRIYLAFSEADHKFSHLQVLSPGGKKIWHFRTRESVCELQPLIDEQRVIFFTNGAMYCLSRLEKNEDQN